MDLINYNQFLTMSYYPNPYEQQQGAIDPNTGLPYPTGDVGLGYGVGSGETYSSTTVEQTQQQYPEGTYFDPTTGQQVPLDNRDTHEEYY